MTLVSDGVFVSARSRGWGGGWWWWQKTKGNTTRQQVRLDSRDDDRDWGWSMKKEASPYNTPLRMEPAQFLIFCLRHETCFVLSLASARGGLSIFSAYLFQCLSLFTLGGLACGFNLLSFFVMVVLSLQPIKYSMGTLGFDRSVRSQRQFKAYFPLSRLTERLEERRELLTHGV